MESTHTFESSAGSTTISQDMRPPLDICSYKLKRVIIPFTWYHINDSNNTLVWIEGATTLTITLTPGNYESPASFTTMLKTLMDAESLASGASETYTCSASNDTGILTISTVATNIGLQLASYTTMAHFLGFTAVNTTPAATSITGTLPISLLPTHVKIYSEIFRQTSSISGTYQGLRTNLFEIIPVNVDGFTMIDYSPAFEQIHKTAKIHLHNTDFSLFDEFGLALGGSAGLNGEKFIIQVNVVQTQATS